MIDEMRDAIEDAVGEVTGDRRTEVEAGPTGPGATRGTTHTT